MTDIQIEQLDNTVRLAEAQAKTVKGRADFTQSVVLPGIIENVQGLLMKCDPADVRDLNQAANDLLSAQHRLFNVARRALSEAPACPPAS